MISPEGIPIFFIVSKGRSGSTLLLNLLDAHPNVSIPLESTFLVHLYTKYKYVKVWNKKTADEYLVDLYRMRKVRRRWKLKKEVLREKLYALVENGNASYANFSKLVYLNYESIYPKSNVLIVGDKNPIYSHSIPKIRAIYPDAKFIHLTRDARANIRSHMLAFNSKFISFIACKWVHYNAEIEKNKALHPSLFLTVRYEDLVETSEAMLKSISNFLDINYASESFDFYKIVKQEYGKYEKYKDGVHASLTKPIDKRLSNQWESFFTEKQQGIINEICQDYLRKYGYEFKQPSLSINQKVQVLKGKIGYKVWIFCVNGFYNSPFWVKKFVFKVIQLVFK